MKLATVDFNVLAEDIKNWGVNAEVAYDDNGEAWVIRAGDVVDYGIHSGQHEMTIGPGFEYRPTDGSKQILGYIDRVTIFNADGTKSDLSSRPQIITQSRVKHCLSKRLAFITISGLK